MKIFIKATKSILIFVSILFLCASFVYGVGFSSQDSFTSDGSSSTDAKSFVGINIYFTIQSSDIMVACYDYAKDQGADPEYETCFAANQQDFDDCEAYDSWLSGMGFEQSATPETSYVTASSSWTAFFDGRYYKNCDGLGGGNLYGVDEKEYWIFSKRKFDCDDGVPSWYTYDAEGYVNPSDYDYKEDISCPANKKCSESDDDVWVYTYNGAINNPCRWDDGQSCSSDIDCWSNECVHGTCRATDPYCDDGYCDAGETYSNCPEDCCDNDCTGYSDQTCRSVCDSYNGCNFYSSPTKSACNGESWNNDACVDANTYVTCCEGSPVDCSSGDYCSGGYCYDCSTVCDGSCQSVACYGTDPDCDDLGNPTQSCCGNNDCDYLEGGETYSNCPADCCVSDCTADYDSTCHSICNTYNGCSFTAGCNSYSSGTNICINSTAYANCCSGTPTNCQSGQTCSNGVCLGADLAIIKVVPIQVVPYPYVKMVKDRTGYVRVIVKNLGALNVTGKVNVTFEGTPLVPYNPTSASKLIIAGTNESFDFVFKPTLVGLDKQISANVTIIG